MAQNENSIKTTIAPWLSVTDAGVASAFYQQAFNAVETYRLEPPGGGIIVRLSVNGAEFWLSSGEGEQPPLGAGTIRMILAEGDPETFFARALKAGAIEIYPVGEEHGWKLGRLEDPFGLHWEIGYMME